MIRVLTPAPEQYNAPKLTSEMQAVFSSCVAVNEVEAEKKYVAVYFKDNVVPAEAEIAAIVAAHDPTPAVQPPTTTERIAALEAALLELMLREV